MPLINGATGLLTAQLERLKAGERVSVITIGHFTEFQFLTLNRMRLAAGFHPVESPEIVYLGRHHWNSRSAQHYDVADLVIQIEHACCAEAEPGFQSGRYSSTTLQYLAGRIDARGARVQDLAIFECTSRKPRAELFSVIPKGDRV